MKKIIALAVCLSFTTCTAAQWREFQQIEAQVNNDVSNASGVLNMIMNMVLLGSGDNAIVAMIRGLVISCESFLMAEAQVVINSPTPLDTPAQIAAAFPQFLAAWDQLSAALGNINIQVPTVPIVISSGSPSPGLAGARHAQWPVPRLVLRSLPHSLPGAVHR